MSQPDRDRRAPIILEMLTLTRQGLRAPAIRSTLNVSLLGAVLAHRWVAGLESRAQARHQPFVTVDPNSVRAT